MCSLSGSRRFLSVLLLLSGAALVMVSPACLSGSVSVFTLLHICSTNPNLSEKRKAKPVVYLGELYPVFGY